MHAALRRLFVSRCQLGTAHGGLPSEVMPSAAVMHSRASGGEIAGLDSTLSASTGPRKATVWMPLRTRSTGTPFRTCGVAAHQGEACLLQCCCSLRGRCTEACSVQ